MAHLASHLLHRKSATAAKYGFILKILSSYGLENGKKCSIVWKVDKSAKKECKGETKLLTVRQKTVEWDEDFKFATSLEPKKDATEGYEERQLHFYLKETDDKGKGKSVGETDINLSDMINGKGEQKVISIRMKK